MALNYSALCMSLVGQSRHFDRALATSGLPRLSDILRVGRHVSKVPLPDSCIAAKRAVVTLELAILAGLVAREARLVHGLAVGLALRKLSEATSAGRAVFCRVLDHEPNVRGRTGHERSSQQPGHCFRRETLSLGSGPASPGLVAVRSSIQDRNLVPACAKSRRGGAAHALLLQR